MNSIQPSQKSPAVESALTRLFGFDRREHIHAMQCVPAPIGCGKPITTAFRNEISEREYAISGLCQACQDKFFGTD